MTGTTSLSCLSLALAGAWLFAPSAVHAGEAPASDADVAAAIAAFNASFSKAGADERPALVVSFSALPHRKVGERLAAISEDERVDAETRAACFTLLAERAKADDRVAPRVVKWLRGQSAVAAKAMAKGECGVPVNPRTGEVDTASVEVKRALTEGEQRAKVTAAALRAAAVSATAPKDAAELVRPFLQSPFDAVAVAALHAVRLWKPGESLPDLLQLFRMYPKENRWESGAVVHGGGTNATAQRAWMVAFGHPLKQRPRPDVVRALKTAVESVCRSALDTPEALEAHMRSGPPDRSDRR